MATELKELMDHAVARVALPPNLAQTVAERYERGRRRRRGKVAILTVIVLGLTGVLAWTVSGGTRHAGVSTVTPTLPTPAVTSTPAPPATSKPIPPPLAPPATVTVVTKHEQLDNGQASLDPPARGQAPADPTAAWNRIAATLPGNPCDDAKPETVQFGLFTYGYPVPEPALNKTPEWVLRCVDNPARPAAGPAYLSGEPHPTPTESSTPILEDFISVFDARTGKLLMGWNEPAS